MPSSLVEQKYNSVGGKGGFDRQRLQIDKLREKLLTLQVLFASELWPFRDANIS